MKNIVRRARLVPVIGVFALVLGALPSGDALARHNDPHRWTSGAITFKTAFTSPDHQGKNDQNWTTVGAGTVFVPIFPGRTALINARYTAESQCTGTAGAWCSVRIVIFGVNGEPNENDGSNFAFDSVSTPAFEQDFWEAHAMERHLCVANRRTTTVFVPVIVQWRSVGNALFRLDETSLAAERSDNCGPIDLFIQ